MASTIAKTRDGIRRGNTQVTGTPDTFTVKLYSTIVYHEAAGRVLLRTGGWATSLTTSRINQALAHRGVGGHVNIKDGNVFYNGKPFVNGQFVIER